MKVVFRNNFFGPNHTLYRKDTEYDVPAEWKKILPSTTEILEEPKKSNPKQADTKKAEVKDEDDPKAIAKAQEDEVKKILEGKTK